MREANLSKQMQQHTYAIMNRVENSHWWYVGRRAILESFLERISNELRIKVTNHELRILDVGCGTGGNLEMLEKFGAAEGVDVSDEALEFCESKGLTAHRGLAEELPFANESFDVVTALDVVEHLDDDIAGLSEMHRVLKRGGKTLVFVPAFMFLWGVQDDVSNHRIRYTKKQIVERLEKSGFEIERATYANWTFFAPILAGRTLMKITGIKPASENNVNISALNGIFGKIFGAEKLWLRNFDFPFGVSIVIVAKKK
ncbi:MAG: methyltransferase domain-containing protein [Pyrinomonadaceae bacterium]